MIVKSIFRTRGIAIATFLTIFTGLITSCEVGPNYVRPSVAVPAKYKEASKDWKIAEPQDANDRGAWWEVFNNPELNTLEEQVNISNQTIAAAEAQYREAVALVYEAEAAFFPTVSGTASAIRQKSSALSPSSNSNVGFQTNTGSVGGGGGRTVSIYTVGITADWEFDLWGSIRRQVEANKAAAQASAATLASTELSTQATLAQDYFQMRTLDVDQKILDDTVIADAKALKLTQSSFKAGTASLSDIASAVTQLKAAQAAAIDNGINRATFEHAIAVLIGQPPSTFRLKPRIIDMTPPPIPIQLPSALLERRPDIAAAERTVASANALIGVAIAAYFPVFELTGTGGFETFVLSKLFTSPMLYWSIGPQLTETILDGGLREAQVAFARATYQQDVALYRQTVLTAYQDVEDNMVALRILKSEAAVQQQAVTAAKLALNLQLNDYKAGTAAYTAVIVAQTNALTIEKANSDIAGRRMVAAAGLIKALGGGWDAASLEAVNNAPIS